MPSPYDDFSDKASSSYTGGTTEQRRLRGILRAAMEREGFRVEPSEWWHFDYKDWRDCPLLDIPFEQHPSALNHSIDDSMRFPPSERAFSNSLSSHLWCGNTTRLVFGQRNCQRSQSHGSGSAGHLSRLRIGNCFFSVFGGPEISDQAKLQRGYFFRTSAISSTGFMNPYATLDLHSHYVGSADSRDAGVVSRETLAGAGGAGAHCSPITHARPASQVRVRDESTSYSRGGLPCPGACLRRPRRQGIRAHVGAG